MDIANAILATLAYYDGLDHPLSLFELYRYLINPQRLKPHIQSLEVIALSDIIQATDELLVKGMITQDKGFFSLKGKQGLSELRLRREKIAAQKWRKCVRRAYWFQAVPWVSGMFVSGSLALGTVNEESDFDVLVVADTGRLYLARLFLSGIASLMGMRRTRFEKVAPDKFCFNHYVTKDALHIVHESLYNAQTYAHLTKLCISPTLAGEFFAANLWINKFVYNFTPHQMTMRRTVQPSPFLRGIARAIEKLGSGTPGNLLESWARRYQQKRIAGNPATHAPGGRVVYTMTELEFHPHSFEKTVLERYNANTRRLGVAMNPEPDSGLRQ